VGHYHRRDVFWVPAGERVYVMVVTRSTDGRYELTAPSGTSDWWEINDTYKGYAVATVQADAPNAKRAAEVAFELIAGGEGK
jgi:hypothetical protein